MDYINQFVNSNDKTNLWCTTPPLIKKQMIEYMFKNKVNDYTKLASELLEFIREDDKMEKRDIHAGYANLLCVVLARSHNPEFIKDITKTKMCGDLFFYIDSTLLFEFSPKQNRETCVKDTIEHVNGISNGNCDITNEWFEIYVKWVNYYGKQYDEKIVIKYWNTYKDPNYYEKFK